MKSRSAAKATLALALLPVAACPGSRTIPPGQSGWVELFQDQDWNDVPAGTGQLFVGTVLYEPGSGEPSYVMRYNPYKLSEDDGQVIDIYCGSSDELEPFEGMRVQIEGRQETLQVEGRVFVEIWPARIRPAGPGTGS